MGAWGTGLYSNDIAEDIREDCRDVFSVKTPEEGLRILEEEYLKEIQEDDYDELADFWYAVSDYQWNKGILTERAKKKALELLERGAGLELWIEEGNKSDIKKRKEVLEKLKEKLNSPQPPKKKIRDSGIHYAIKKGDIIAVRPNEKFTIEFDYKEKQEWINVPYFTAEYLEKEMYERFSEEDKDEEEKRIRYEITYAEGYKPIINKESYMFFLCIEKERIPSGRLVKEVYDEKLTFVQYAYYRSELTNVIERLRECGYTNYVDDITGEIKLMLTDSLWFDGYGTEKYKKIGNNIKEVERFYQNKEREKIEKLTREARFESCLLNYELFHNSMISFKEKTR